VPRFVDTNVLLYSVLTDPDDAHKQELADALLMAEDLVVSTQVLGEFYVQATRPSRPTPLRHEVAVDLVESFAINAVQPVTLAVVRNALAGRKRFGISYWDACIIEAARAAGCAEVLSEDLGHGQDYGGVVVRNPFGSA
jgi:predicted nucleic acid-binding protein